jgi:hypothetical protein
MAAPRAVSLEGAGAASPRAALLPKLRPPAGTVNSLGKVQTNRYLLKGYETNRCLVAVR